MTLTGHVISGQIVLDASLPLPEGATVRVEVVAVPPGNSSAEPATAVKTTLRERLKNFLSHTIDDLPPDAAENHDHYLYGTPKR